MLVVNRLQYICLFSGKSGFTVPIMALFNICKFTHFPNQQLLVILKLAEEKKSPEV